MHPILNYMLATAGNRSRGGFTNTNIPETTTPGAPISFGDLFFSTHGRHPGPMENVQFTLPAGNYRGVAVATSGTTGVNPHWLLGSWPGQKPRSMKLVINGNQYCVGGTGLRGTALRTDIEYNADGGSLMSMEGTETFINSTTPLIIEGNGNLYSGGGGAGGLIYGGTTFTGGPGAGFPQKSWVGSNYTFTIQVITPNGGAASTVGTGGTTGVGGGFGRYGTIGSAGTSPPPATVLGTFPGQPGVIWMYGNNSDARFQNETTVKSIFNWDNFNGAINNVPASTWKNNWNAFLSAAAIGWKNASTSYRLYIFNLPATVNLGSGNA